MTAGQRHAPRRLAGTGLAGAVADAPFGVAFLAADGRVVVTNQRADELLLDSSSLSVTDDRLTAWHPVDDTILQRLVRNALCAGRDAAKDADGCGLQLRGPGFRSALHVQVAPMIPGEGDALAGSGALAVVWLGSRMPATGPTPRALRTRYGLTRAEGDLLAHLAAGNSVTEIAHLRDVARETVRSQIKRVMKKLGVSRQAELVRVVLVGDEERMPRR